MKYLFRLLMVALTMIVVLASCDKKEEDVTLIPDKTTIAADGTDKVTFTVKYGDQDVTAGAEINITDGAKLSSNEFTTAAAGTYKFTASYKGATSKEVTITATEVELPALILSVDKPSIVADNIEEARFTVMQDGVDVTADCNVCMESGLCLLSPVFTTSEAGEYEFYATLKDGDGTNKSNLVKVIAVEHELPFDATKTLHKNVAYFTATASWCSPCNYFKTYMKRVMASYPDNIVQVNFYSGDSKPEVRSTLTNTLVSQLQRNGRFGMSGYPSSVAELRQELGEAPNIPTEPQIRAAYSQYVAYPARTGIKVNSTVGETVNATVTVGAQEAGKYSIGVFLVEDNIIAYQNGGGDNYNHIDVLRAKGMTSVYGEELGEMAVGETLSKEYSFTILDTYDTANLYLVVYTLYEESGNMVIANTVKAKANGLTNYKYVD